MLKKVIKSLLLILAIFVAAFFIWRFISYVNDEDPDKTFLSPRIALAKVEITSLSFEKTEMTSKILIKNPLPISFHADSLDFGVFIGDTEVAKETFKKSIDLNGSDSSWIDFPVTVMNGKLLSLLKEKDREGHDSVEYRLSSSFYTNIGFRKKMDVNVKRLLPLVHVPEVKVDRIEVDSIDFSRTGIRFFVMIKNENPIAWKAKDIKYVFFIEDNELVKGEIPGLTNIEKENTTSLEIPVQLSFKETGKTLFDLLKKGGNVNYKLNFTFTVESENSMINNSKVILKSEDSVKSLVNLVSKR